MTYYDILEVSQNASDSTICAAYRNLAKKFHPDVYNGDINEANLKMSALNKAYDILSDPTKRKKYDAFLHTKQKEITENYNKSETKQNTNEVYENCTKRNERIKSEPSGCLGCLSTICGWIFLIVVISCIFKSCTDEKKDLNYDNKNRTEIVAQTELEETDKKTSFSEEIITPKAVLSEKAKSIEKIFFHKPYTDMKTVEIHSFFERNKVLEYMVEVGTDKNIFDKGCYIACENKLLGDDYYYSTLSETSYYYVGDLKNNRPHGFGAVIGLSDGSGTYDFSGEVLFYYVGDFYNGMKDGFGVEFFADECDITSAAQHIVSLNIVSDENGEFLSRYLFNHVKYEGFWDKNKYNGKGNEFYFPLYDDVYYFHEEIHKPIKGYLYGNAYPNVTKGEWKGGSLSGSVAIYKLNHKEYIGEMKNGKGNGKGISFYPNNQIEYDGQWKNGEPHGKGSYYDLNGELIYSGNWENGDYSH